VGDRLKRVVLKIGGSILFSGKPLSEQVDALSQDLRGCQVFVIIGGGEIVEAMRQLHRFRPELDMGWIHWECVRLLDRTFAISQQLAPSWSSVTTSEELAAALAGEREGINLVRVHAFYHMNVSRPAIGEATSMDAERAEVYPAESWDTTTDTLAWYLAWRISAQEVWLLKSCEWTKGESLDLEQLVKLAENGVVDRELPRLARLAPEIRIRIRSAATQQPFG
jgi:aspartokinase-like uncharacterized kinase